jgi:phosphatidylserine/phosphatidylglycerophosphate/cardiolipin synthase-like enzyme
MPYGMVSFAQGGRLNTKSVLFVGLIGLMLAPFTTAQPADTKPLWGKSSSLVYDNAGQNFIPALNLVRAAKTSIDIEIYEMKDPTFLNAVLDAAKRGVRVRIVKDPNPFANVGLDGVTLSCEWFNPDTAHDEPKCAPQRTFIENARALGAQIVPFDKAQLCDKDATSPKPTCYEHGKLIIADGKRALISTGNFNPDNLCDLTQNLAKCNRDFSVVTADNDVLRTVQRVFDSDLAGKRYGIESIVTGAIQQKLTVSPYSFAPIEGLIRSAKTRLQIENQYLKHPQINRAIQAAARRGVRVEISLANLCEFGVPDEAATKQSTDLFTSFDQAGASVRMFTPSITVKGKPGYMHAKVIVADETRSWVGSVNGSISAVDRNREFGIFVTDAKNVMKLSSLLESDFAASQEWQENLKCRRTRP